MELEFSTKSVLKKFMAQQGDIQVIMKLKGHILENRFKIKESLSEGAFGKVYSGYDSLKREQGVRKAVIIKFSQHHQMHDKEYQTITDIQEFTKSSGDQFKNYFPENYCSGKVLILDEKISTFNPKGINSEDKLLKLLEGQVWSYMVQEKLGFTLEKYLFKRNEPFSPSCAFKIGIQLVDQMRIIHDAGYTYNDLKLDNILVGDCKEMPNYKQTLHQIRMIDFGLAKKYVGENGKHNEKQKEKQFQGNMIFASKNAFNLHTLSRRDDLHSLCYLLLYLIDGDLVFLQKNNDKESEQKQQGFQEDEYIRLRKLKNTLTPEELCLSSESKALLPLIHEVYKLEFSEKPDYQKLKFMLMKCLFDINEIPNKVYDWNKRYVKEEEIQDQQNDDTDAFDIQENDIEMSNFPCVSDLMAQIVHDQKKQQIYDFKTKQNYEIMVQHKNLSGSDKEMNPSSPCKIDFLNQIKVKN